MGDRLSSNPGINEYINLTAISHPFLLILMQQKRAEALQKYLSIDVCNTVVGFRNIQEILALVSSTNLTDGTGRK